MRFQLEQDENIADGFRRIGCQVIDHAIALLSDETIDSDRRVHRVRTAMKRLRSLLRMVRGEIGEEVFRVDDQLFRSVARGLAPNRDQAVLIDTVAKLRQSDPTTFDDRSFFDMWERIAGGRGATLQPDPQILDRSIAMLREGRERIERWEIDRNDFRAFQWGLRRVYRRGRCLCEEALRRPSPELLHDWRRQVKHLWYMMSLLSPMWPRVIRGLAVEYRLLSMTLGQDHDLVLLESRLSPDGAEFASLISAIDTRRQDLLKSARANGGRLFAESPRRHVGRLAVYWKLWRTWS